MSVDFPTPEGPVTTNRPPRSGSVQDNVYSTFADCSRIRSSRDFMVTTRWEIG